MIPLSTPFLNSLSKPERDACFHLHRQMERMENSDRLWTDGELVEYQRMHKAWTVLEARSAAFEEAGAPSLAGASAIAA